MAKASWCTVAPMSGSKNGSIAISASAHTGRAARTTNVIVTNANGTRPTASIAVNQAAAPVSTTIDATKPDIPKTGGTVVVNGTSNSQKLRAALKLKGETSLKAFYESEATISINGGPDTALVRGGNGDYDIYAPNGDPGATAKYNYRITITFHASIFPIDIPFVLRVFDSRHPSYEAAAIPDTALVLPTPVGAVDCTFKLLAGASTVSASPATVNLAAAGTAQNVAITSNDDWTVS